MTRHKPGVYDRHLPRGFGNLPPGNLPRGIPNRPPVLLIGLDTTSCLRRIP